MWDTSPPRQVTAADAVLGLKRACNPAQPFGGLPDFETHHRGLRVLLRRLRQGQPDRGSRSSVHRQPPDLRRDRFRPDHHLQAGPPGAVPSRTCWCCRRSTRRRSRASTTCPRAPRRSSTSSLTARTRCRATRRPAASCSCATRRGRRATDPIRKAYVDKIVVNETGQPETIQQQLQTNTAAASMEWDAAVPVAADPGPDQPDEGRRP